MRTQNKTNLRPNSPLIPPQPARTLAVLGPFSLRETCAPVTWSGGRWPQTGWREGEFVAVAWEPDGATAPDAGQRFRVTWRIVREGGPGVLLVRGSAEPDGDEEWGTRVLGLDQRCPSFADPVVEALRLRFAGLRPFADGSVFAGLVTAIVGQSISVAAAAVTTARLAALFHEGIDLDGQRYWPLPRADQLADADPALVHRSGVTRRRAEALVAAGRAVLAGAVPDRAAALADPEGTCAALRALPLVGPWTAEATLLWGIGLPDAHVTGDVALLRAARRLYGRPDMTLRDLDRLADGWRPARAWAARLLWADLLGIAP